MRESLPALLHHRCKRDKTKGAAGIGGYIAYIYTLRKMQGIDISIGRKREKTIAAVAIVQFQYITATTEAFTKILPRDGGMYIGIAVFVAGTKCDGKEQDAKYLFHKEHLNNKNTEVRGNGRVFLSIFNVLNEVKCAARPSYSSCFW